MKISKSIMLSMVVVLFAVPFTNVMASDDERGCDYDLREGAVYANENRTKRDADGNAQQNRVVVFSRGADGLLTEVQRAESGGYGNDDGIVTSGQFSVIVTEYGKRQYVMMINPGFDPTSDSLDGSVSAFRVNKCDVTLTDTASTKGQEPRSVARDSRRVLGYTRDLVGVVNAGTGEVEFNGCPGLPEGFAAPTGIICGPRPPVDEFESTSYTLYKFNNRRGKFRRIANADTRDENGDPAQGSFINEGRQFLIAQRNTFFALGDGTEDDIMEVVKLRLNGKPMRDRSGFKDALAKLLGYNLGGEALDDIAPRFTNPVVSNTTGNDNFGFEPIPVDGEDFNDCMVLTHGSFQQRDQGGTSQVRVNKFGSLRTIQPNKPDGGSDTCWTAFSKRTNTLYSVAFFDSEVSIRGLDPATCVMTDGGPPLDLSGAAPTFAPPPGNSLRHRVSNHPNQDDELGQQRNDTASDETSFPNNQSDFLYEAGGLDMNISKSDKGAQYLYIMSARVPFAIGQNSSGDWLYPPEDLQLPICNFGTCTATDIAIFRVVEDCDGETTIFGDDCRPGDLVWTGRSTGLPGSSFGVAAY